MARVRITSSEDSRDDFEVPASTSINRKYDNTITKFPVETGVNVSDNISKSNLIMTIEASFSPKAIGIDPNLFLTPNDAFVTLLKLRNNGTKLTVTAYDVTHENMYIKSLSLNKLGDTLTASIVLEQIRVTEVQFVALPSISEEDSDKGAGETKGNLTFEESTTIDKELATKDFFDKLAAFKGQ